MTRARTRVAVATFLGVFALVLGGCARLQITLPPPAGGDWLTEGGGEGRSHFTPHQLAPPLDEQWQVNIEALPAPGGATVIGDYVLVGTRRGDLLALDRRSGRKLGRRRVAPALSGAPLIVGNLAVVTAAAGTHTVIAYDLHEGRVQWRAETGHIESSAARAGDAVIVADVDGVVSAFRVSDGEALWSAVPDSTAQFRASPLVAETRVIVADDRGAVTALRTEDGSTLWRAELGRPIHATPAYFGGKLFVSTMQGVTCAVDVADGSTTWCHDVGDAVVRMSGAAVGAGLAVWGGTDGIVHAVDVGTGEAQWSISVGAGIAAAPLMAGEFLYVGTLDGRIVSLDVHMGEEIWAGEVPGRVHAPPVPAGNRILVLSAPRHVTAFARR